MLEVGAKVQFTRTEIGRIASLDLASGFAHVRTTGGIEFIEISKLSTCKHPITGRTPCEVAGCLFCGDAL